MGKRSRDDDDGGDDERGMRGEKATVGACRGTCCCALQFLCCRRRCCLPLPRMPHGDTLEAATRVHFSPGKLRLGTPRTEPLPLASRPSAMSRLRRLAAGQMTSHIKNKQRRNEIYNKLRHKKAVRRPFCGRLRSAVTCAAREAAAWDQLAGRTGKRRLTAAPSGAAPTPSANAAAREQVAKKKERVKRQKEVAAALQLGQEPPARKVPKTIESTRERDETVVVADDEELEADTAEDEFAAHFNREQAPQILVTTSRKPSGSMFKFLENLFETLPNATYYARRDYEIKRIVEYAKGRGFTDLLVWNENSKFSKGSTVNGLLAVHLPEGPSAHFKVSNVVLTKDIKARRRPRAEGGWWWWRRRSSHSLCRRQPLRGGPGEGTLISSPTPTGPTPRPRAAAPQGHGRATSHVPELILNNFTTRLGHRVGRMFASLFPQDPNFRGRRVVRRRARSGAGGGGLGSALREGGVSGPWPGRVSWRWRAGSQVTLHNQRDFIFFRHHRYIFEQRTGKCAPRVSAPQKGGKGALPGAVCFPARVAARSRCSDERAACWVIAGRCRPPGGIWRRRRRLRRRRRGRRGRRGAPRRRR